MRISDWSSDVCSSDLLPAALLRPAQRERHRVAVDARARKQVARAAQHVGGDRHRAVRVELAHHRGDRGAVAPRKVEQQPLEIAARSEQHTSELQSLMRISYAVFCLKKKKTQKQKNII